ncbi:MAG: hypothetical protein RLZZ432_128 [Chloroflexota bacterium]
MRRTLTTLILVVAGVRLVLAYAPPAGDVGTIDGSPSPSPDGSPAPDASASAAPTATPAASAGASATPKPTATPTPASGGTATLHNGTFTSATINARYGSISSTVVFSGGAITSVTLNGNWDNAFGWRSGCTIAEYENAAIGLSSKAAIGDVFSASFCSGATVTRQTYVKTLQSAFDKATY